MQLCSRMISAIMHLQQLGKPKKETAQAISVCEEYVNNLEKICGRPSNTASQSTVLGAFFQVHYLHRRVVRMRMYT